MNTPTEEKLLQTIALTMTDDQGDEYMHALTDAIAAGVTIDQIRDYTQHALRGGKIDPDTTTQVQETLADDRDCIIPQAWADTIKAAHDTHRCLIRDTLDATTYEDQPGHVTIDADGTMTIHARRIDRIGGATYPYRTSSPTTIDPARYTSTVQAVQWDGTQEHAARITEWIFTTNRIAVYLDDPARIEIPTDGRPLTVDPHDWIARDDTGDYSVHPADDFAITYRPAPDDDPTDAEVEAAARAMFGTRDDPYDDTEWGELTSADRERWECYARAALVAARAAARHE